MLIASSAAAQHTTSGYFLDNYNYRYEMNPAFGNENNKFISLPVAGNINAGMLGNLGVSDVIYTRSGKTMLFTNPEITTAEVMKNISDKNTFGANVKLDIMSVGFKGFGGYNAVSIKAVANANVNVPGALFSLAKEGVANATYDISDMRVRAESYAEIALNHSHNITKDLRIGGTLKFLVGVGAADAYFNQASLTLGENDWTAVTNADIYASLGGFQYDHDIDSDTGREYVSGGNFDDGFKIQGFGMALDLGAEYKFRDFTFSAALLDLGFIDWGKTHYASTNGTQTFNTDAYTFNVDDDATNSFDNEWDNFTANLDKLYQLSDNGIINSRTRMLAATMNIGVQYELPYYRRLSFGLLNTTHFNAPFTWTQFRLSANVRPVNCFSASANVAVGTYGTDFGWLLNFNTTGFNIFLGMDHTFSKLAKQGVPLGSSASLNFGIDIPL
jgi:hypothetical protein